MKLIVQRKCFFFSLLLLFFVQLNAQEAENKGYKVNAEGVLEIADSLLPKYLLQYGSAGLYRNGYRVPSDNYASVGHLISIPVLVGEGISREQSLAWFSRSLLFNLTGRDPEGAYFPESGNSNITLPSWVRNFLGTKYERTEDLFNEQCAAGNILVVDNSVYIPLLIQGSDYAAEQEFKYEFGHYYTALVNWSAAYPWFFYTLPNITLRIALARNDRETLRLFALNRFTLSERLVNNLRAEKYLPIPN